MQSQGSDQYMWFAGELSISSEDYTLGGAHCSSLIFGAK
jgi:hypothetical protein